MSLFEIGYSSGIISLAHLFETKEVCAKMSGAGLKDIAEMIVRGGWPGSIGMDI